MQNNHVVIMAGGIGSRFWPLSTPEYPKQFIDILGCGRTLIQLTVDRFYGICSQENFWVVTNAAYVDIVKNQLPDILEHHILAEPEARNTAPCIAWACWTIQQECEDANIVVTPADAVVMNPREFQRVIVNALQYTKDSSSIVTIGINPSRPETGYGYVEIAEVVEGEIHRVQAFKEKPSWATAKDYLAKGTYLWNAGIFVWNVQTIMNSIQKYNPGIALKMDEIIATGNVNELFPQCEKISIDYAVMEPAAAEGKVFTHPADFGWSDLGNWTSLHDKLTKDVNNNCSVGVIELHDCSNCIVHMEEASHVILQGLEGFIVAEKNGRFLVCNRTEEQRIKEFLINDKT